ncbi:hypothetical protein SAMN05216410_2670 [Sanguibacter gelidistatuariae]|uniref:Prenyltransferase and squalene oxidase repeat-containing protein n=1 Tax=Sanguibacter gelidistatuariae TaxID=1814289 RepID=A0A1G6RF05_9MICO|nr:prenyltransferase/squalene oxidase repeat-containing protein [Sanguibacter gelidistatuariae]SDD03021.1 hypothetical protein SAMN05216410_2670 [Sanguibacter gelidistatuariae]
MTRRSVPLVAVAATFLALAGCSGTDSPSASTPPTSPSATATSEDAAPSQAAAETAAAWLVTSAAGASILQTEFDGTAYDDYGLTADVTLALLAVGDVDSAQTFAAALAAPDAVAAYIGDGATAQYAGSTAKLLATLATSGIDTSDLGGRDLVSELVALQAPSGRFSDLGADDYSITVSQAWAVLALNATAEAPQAAVDYLTAQQCAGAGFPEQLSDVSPADCVPDVDATAFAVSALLGAGVPVGAPAVADSLAWLETARSTDAAGQSWAAAGSEDANINSTSVVAAALTDADVDTAPVLSWLESQIITTGADTGAFPLAGTANVRVSAQATLALAGTGLRGLIG